MSDQAKSKLKRSRLKRAEHEVATGPVELLRPTPDAPAIRRYVPREGLDHGELLARFGALDWRDLPPDAPPVSVADIADRIICGDSVQCLRRLPEACVACVVTSPPYWNVVDYGVDGQIGPGSYEDYLEDLLAVWRECERVLIPNGKLCINAPIIPVPKAVMSHQHTRHLKNLSNDIEASILRSLTLQRYSLYIWQKQTTEKMFGSYPYPPNLFEQNTVEFINVFVKPGAPRRMPPEVKAASRLTEGEWMNLTRQVWRLYPADVKREGHPAPFPEALPNRLIAMYTFARCEEAGALFPGDLVLDPFCGTGATCAAARKLGRRFVGIDLAPDFAVAAAERSFRASFDGRIALSRDR